MWFSATPCEICFSTTMFYSIFLVSKCRSDDIPRDSIEWKNNGDSFQIYKTDIPWIAIDLEDAERNHFAFMAWTAVLTVVVIVAVIVCICCICWKFYPKQRSRRQSSNAALVHPDSRTILTFQTNPSDNTRLDNSSTRTGNVYSRGVVNFSFTSSVEDPLSTMELDDCPPEYSAVVSENSKNDKPPNTSYPHVCETKKVETPPPAYITIAPFDNTSKTHK